MPSTHDNYADLFGGSVPVVSPLDIARNYIERGFAVVPIEHKSKGPQIPRWGELRIHNNTVERYFSSKPANIGVILGTASGDLVDVDIDCPEAVDLAKVFMPPTGAVFGRRSNPRSHHLYRAPGIISTKIKDPETSDSLIELRSNTSGQPSQTVFPGSTHPDGEAIAWEEAGEPAVVDGDGLQHAFEKTGAAAILARHFPSNGGRHDATMSLIGFLVRSGWAEAAVVEFVQAVRQCSGADRRKPIAKMTRDAVKRLSADKTLFGLPSLRTSFGEKAANRVAELLPCEARPLFDDDAAIAELDDLEPHDEYAALFGETTADAMAALMRDSPGDPIVARLNGRHAVVANRGRTLITTERSDGSVDFGTVRDLETFYANDRIPLPKGKVETAATRWLRSLDRRTFPDGLTFAPGGCESGTLNLWRGWAVEPDPTASCDLFLAHVRDVVCRGDASHFNYVIKWLAHLVQRPAEKPGVAVVLRGGKGAGKDTVGEYVAHMIGRRHAPTVAESDHIVGKFNARLENALLLHVQEGSWAGDRKAEGVLKYLVTSDRIEIERKGIDSFNLPSVLRLFISANAEWVVPASEDERRWAAFEVSDHRRGDAAYFRALRAEMEGRGPAALLHHLRGIDLTGFDVRAAPETDGLRNQKVASLRNVEAWWFDRLTLGALLNPFSVEWENQGQTVSRDEFREAYAGWMRGRRYDGETLDSRQFGKRIRTLAPAIESIRGTVPGGYSRPWQYRVPPLSECRAAFEAWIGGPIEWEAAQ